MNLSNVPLNKLKERNIMGKLVCNTCGNKEEFYKLKKYNDWWKITGEYMVLYDGSGNQKVGKVPLFANSAYFMEPKNFKCLDCDSTVILK